MNLTVTVNHRQLLDVLLNVGLIRPVFIWGAPGIGKSAIVQQFADSLGLECVSLLGSQLAPEDIIGVPQIKDGFSQFCPPRTIARSEPYVLFLDELPEFHSDVLEVLRQPMEEGRVRMGWHAAERPAYVRCFYEEPAGCRQLILDCDVALFGGTDEESYIVPRLASGGPVMRYSERLYKTGQWKAISPRGLLKKYSDHTRYRKAPVYLLCAGAYVPSDFHMIRAYPGENVLLGIFSGDQTL